MSELTNFLESNKDLAAFSDMIEQIMSLDEATLNQDTVDIIIGAINGSITPKLREDAIQNFINQAKLDNLSKTAAQKQVIEAKQIFEEFIEELKPSELKRKILTELINSMFSIINEAAERYGIYDFILPIKLDKGAQVPTYAHESDAAADIYAFETVTLPAHSIGNMIKTGVYIELPEGWTAIIAPRSSIGKKTGLRLSNSIGIIDEHYRGEIGVLYDNISDSDYTINAGDRIAQMMVIPSHHFKAKIVEEINETDRNDGGFGSSGK